MNNFAPKSNDKNALIFASMKMALPLHDTTILANPMILFVA